MSCCCCHRSAVCILFLHHISCCTVRVVCSSSQYCTVYHPPCCLTCHDFCVFLTKCWISLATTTIMTDLLARHLCGVVVMHVDCCDVCHSMLLLSVQYLSCWVHHYCERAMAACTLSQLSICVAPHGWQYLRSPRSMAVCLRGERYLISLLVV